MKIDLNSLNLDSSHIDRATLRQTPSPAHAEVSAEGAQDADAASLSLDHTNMQSLTAQALSAPAIRQDKVDALRQAIASGQYSMTPEQLADAMIQDASQLEP
jgi:flagellar biosynthesis anti-sigma factor FlgM